MGSETDGAEVKGQVEAPGNIPIIWGRNLPIWHKKGHVLRLKTKDEAVSMLICNQKVVSSSLTAGSNETKDLTDKRTEGEPFNNRSLVAEITPSSAIATTVLLGNGRHVLIDLADLEVVNQHTWTAHWIHNNWYAVRVVDGETIYLHRFLMRAEKGQRVDHRSGDGLDCRRENLRICTHRENNLNRRPSSGRKFKGVTHRPKGKDKQWQARIRVNGEQFSLGYFTTAEEAARAYDVAAAHHFGDFAWLNFQADRSAVNGRGR